MIHSSVLAMMKDHTSLEINGTGFWVIAAHIQPLPLPSLGTLQLSSFVHFSAAAVVKVTIGLAGTRANGKRKFLTNLLTTDFN